MRRVLCGLLFACGSDDRLPPAPDELVEGPVTIDTRTMTLTIGTLSIEQFVSIGTSSSVDETQYYDPRGDERVTLAAPRVLGADGDSVVLEGGTRLRLVPCAIAGSGATGGAPSFAGDCAMLELDASAHAGAVHLQLALPKDPAEPLYGTGDAARSVNVAGAVREMQLRVDPRSESSLNETHVPVPLVLWPRRGIGLFAADDRPAAFDLGAAAADRVTTTFTLPERGTYRFLLYTAPSPIDLVRRYVELTTKPALPPRWAFAPQQWRNVWNSSDEVRGDADEMRTRDIPGSVMWIDNPWQTAYNSFVVDETRFVAMQQLVADLTARGYKVVFWSTPYVGLEPELASDRAEGAAADFFVTDDAEKILDYPWQDGPGALVDFTRPGAIAWWRERIDRVVSIGAAGFKLDFGEEVVPDLGGTVVRMLLAAGDNSSHHRRYAEGYHAAYLGAFPPGEGFLITRSGAWGEQHVNTSIWPGDLDSDFSQFGDDNGEGMANVGGLPSAVSRGLSLSVSGYPFYGSDIGGFRGFPTTESLLRWAQYAAFGSIMQLGGGGPNHNPWDSTLFDPGADAIYKIYADLHMRLNPYLWTLAQQAAADGTPMTIPARFVADCACDDAMFFLGDAILVAPVVTEGATTREVTLPPGRWLDLNSGAIVDADGRTAFTVPAPLAVLPRWQLVGTVVPMFARYADTLLPATAPGVTSYADPAFGSELRLVYTPVPGSLESPVSHEFHDGTRLGWVGPGMDFGLTAGTDYRVFTFDIDARSLEAPFSAPASVTLDGVDLPRVSDVLGCPAPGCYSFDANKRLQIRVLGQSFNVSIR